MVYVVDLRFVFGLVVCGWGSFVDLLLSGAVLDCLWVGFNICGMLYYSLLT